MSFSLSLLLVSLFLTHFCLILLFITFFFFFFFFNDTATTEIYTLSLHDALSILASAPIPTRRPRISARSWMVSTCQDRKSTRLNSSHLGISYAVFCLKKKKTDIWRR